MDDDKRIVSVVRDTTTFAGLREPIQARDDLIPRMARVRELCGDAIEGPLTNIFYYDTPVEGYDSEVGFPVSRRVESDGLRTHTLRRLPFFAAMHQGPVSDISKTTRSVYRYMYARGLSPELELVELYHHFDPRQEGLNRIEVRASYLAWPEVFRTQLQRVLGDATTAVIWAGGEKLTPHTEVDERILWVRGALEKLNVHADPAQQFDILSHVALVRPKEDRLSFKRIYEEQGLQAVLDAQSDRLATGPTGAPVDPWTYRHGVLHLSKVPRDREAYDRAQNHDEVRRAFCHCALVREAVDPELDPMFCYRAAGWARQFYEPMMGQRVKSCHLTHSILSGDAFCAWDFTFEDEGRIRSEPVSTA